MNQKELLDAAKVLVEYSGTDESLRRSLLEAFPELNKESEDERIRKAIIDHFKSFYGFPKLDAFPIEKIFAWLEKQKSENFDTLEEELNQEWNKCQPVDEGMGLEIAEIEHEQFDNIAKHFYILGLKQQIPVKLDEENIDGYVDLTISAIESFYDTKNPLREKLINWLESLKLLQSKTEWNEEDKRMLTSVIWHLRHSVNNGDTEHTAGQLEEWLNSLNPLKSVWHDARKSVPEKGHQQQIICITDDGLAIRTVDRLASGTRVWCFLSDIAPKNI